jgi:hypothetical protein
MGLAIYYSHESDFFGVVHFSGFIFLWCFSFSFQLYLSSNNLNLDNEIVTNNYNNKFTTKKKMEINEELFFDRSYRLRMNDEPLSAES